MSGSASKSPALGRVGRLGMANGTHKTTATMVAVTTKLYRGGKMDIEIYQNMAQAKSRAQGILADAAAVAEHDPFKILRSVTVKTLQNLVRRQDARGLIQAARQR